MLSAISIRNPQPKIKWSHFRIRKFFLYYPFGNRRLISLRSDFAISCGWRSLRLRLVVFLVSIWLAQDFRYTILPVPVFLKRLAAARFVFIFGITLTPKINFFDCDFLRFRSNFLSRKHERWKAGIWYRFRFIILWLIAHFSLLHLAIRITSIRVRNQWDPPNLCPPNHWAHKQYKYRWRELSKTGSRHRHRFNLILH